MIKIEVKTRDGNRVLEYCERVLASEVLTDVGVMLSKPCGGRGVCGKCKILLNGETVLACKTYIDSDSTIEYIHDFSEISGIVGGESDEYPYDPIISCGYGAAIDIGTTTIAGYVYKFPEGTLVKSICRANPQSEFGADVISRIDSYSKGNGEKLSYAVKSVIREITDGYGVDKYVICGNTAMLHLLTGKDPRSMAVAPYEAEELFGVWQENTYLMRCSSSYVGADVVAAVLASGMMNYEKALLIDIGTNGEMVLKSGDELIACSTAAGPCFEGADIACGTQAISGAINSVSVNDGQVLFTTIGDATPIGLCGTGLVDAVAALLKIGLIDETGYMEEEYHFGDSNVHLAPSDIRKFQLAKAAVRSGIETLLHHAGIAADELDAFYIAGGFGSYLDTGRAADTGLIPRELVKKARAIGNGAGIGASILLKSKGCLVQSERIASEIKTISLATDVYFMDKYIENMEF